jgi:hypothetical protein
VLTGVDRDAAQTTADLMLGRRNVAPKPRTRPGRPIRRSGALAGVVALAGSWPNSPLTSVTNGGRLHTGRGRGRRPQRTRITRALERDIIKRYESGQPTRKIAAALDIAKATVLRVLHEANVQMRPTGAHY